MLLELKKAIFAWMCDNQKEFQLVNATTQHFRQYIFTPEGEYCIGGQKVSEFISLINKTVFND